MATSVLDARALNRALLARQGLLKRRRIGIAAMVHACGGLQSQEPKDPYVALWSRLSGFSRERLHAAAEQREIVRGSYLRATIHTVAVDDFLAFRPVLQEVLDREMQAAHWRARSCGFDGTQVEPHARALLARRPMSAQELGEALLAHFPNADKAGLGHWARTRLTLAMVPNAEERWGYPRPPRFLPAEQWLQQPLHGARIEELLLHGLAAIGPASAADLRTWTGLRGLAPLLEALRPQLRTFSDEAGRELFDLPDAPRPRADTPAPVRLLPEYDNALLSHEDRSRIVPPEHARRFAMGANGRRSRAVLVDGFVRASWDWQRERAAATLRVQCFERPTAAQRDEIADEADALLRFLEPDAAHHAIELK